jgi:ABC-type polysaccharide/polyol phosphate export permease
VIICFNPFPYYFEYVRQGMVDATVTASWVFWTHNTEAIFVGHISTNKLKNNIWGFHSGGSSDYNQLGSENHTVM